MTLVRQLVNAFTKAQTERLPAVGSGVGSLGALSGGNLVRNMSTYGEVSWVFAAVSRVAEAVAAAEWKLYRGPIGDNSVEVTNHPALDVWNSANEFDTGQEFREMGQQHFELTGEEWWSIIRARPGGPPAELWAIRPDRMTPIKSPDEYLVGYIYQLGAEKIPLEIDDVIFIRRPSPLDPYRGMGPIQSLILDLGSEVEAANFNRSFFRNDATPGGVIMTDRTMSNNAFNQMVDRWKTMHQGTSNAGRIAFLERATFVERKFTQREMQFTDLRNHTKQVVLAAYGVSESILGLMGDSNRANAEAALVQFMLLTVKPRLMRLRASLNTRFLPMFPGSEVHFDFVDPVPDNRERNLEEATRGFEAGILTLNESRTLMGHDEVPDGDDFKAPPAPPAPPVMVEPPEEELRALTGKKAFELPAPISLAERLMQMAWERRLEAEAKAINAFLDDMLGKMRESGSGVNAKRVMAYQKIEPSDIAAYNWDWWTRYGPEVIEELTAAFRASIVNEWPQIEPLMADDLAKQYAEVRGARLLRLDGDLNIVNATRQRVNVLVARTIENGDSLQTLQRALRDDFGFSSSRANSIARTETATAQGQGAKGAAIAQGFDEKRWITQGDEHVDSPCLLNESQGWIKSGDPFASGDDTIPQHPRCLIGSSLVSAQGITAASKRWYEGEVIVIRTTSGNQLTCTPNHPILTTDGWVSAGLLKETHHVISRSLSHGVVGSDIDDNLIPTPIEQIADSLVESGQMTPMPVPTTAEDFHGDGADSHVAIIFSNRELNESEDSTFTEPVVHHSLIGRLDNDRLIGLVEDGSGTGAETVITHDAALAGSVSSRDLILAGSGSHAGPFSSLGVTLVPEGDPHLIQASVDDLSGYSIPTSEQIRRIAGHVFADQVFDIWRRPFSGHVYNLETDDGFYVADSIITHNCRCNVRYRVPPIAEERNVSRCPSCDSHLVANNQGSGMYCRRCKEVVNVQTAPVTHTRKVIEYDDDDNIQVVEETSWVA